ncbi:MAG TPA: CapA family protein [Candidatus Avoscillospira stercorigallinarum]|uniref:CapA family protein n=1 Tax=Candidatus Avoscillospira stercorigallinarum TaxID=2840708 RepID=A0A9D0Z634_9FIRM|nr:CapA family protein [Candidatus Avoscillospira stercorigallinarum]
MPNQEYDEYERDEEVLEQRRLKRLEMKRRHKIKQRIVFGAAALILILAVVLIVRGCTAEKEPPEQEVVTPPPTVPEEPEPVEPDKTATLAAVGDIMMYQDQIDAAQQEDSTYNFADCFSAIKAYTSSADLTVGNLELNLCGTTPYSGNPRTAPYFNAPDILAQNLADIGFDILQTANTYSIMNGINGLTSTMNILNAAGIEAVGTHLSDPGTTGGYVIREINGIKIAFIAFTKGLNNMTLPLNSEYCVDLLYTDYNSDYSIVDTTGIMNRLDAAKAESPDIIVAMLHWGAEYDTTISSTQEDITDLLLKNGVDVILGSHSHIVSKMEMVDVETVEGEKKQCFVAYSLGNFISYMPDKANAMESVILNLEFTKSSETGETTISNVSYTPLYILDQGEEADIRFQVLPIRAALKSSLFADYETVMEEAIDHLKTNTNSQFDSGN